MKVEDAATGVGGDAMFGKFRHRVHYFDGLIHSSIESAFLTATAVLALLALLVFYLGLLAIGGP
jgi:hypothetical protein